MGVWQKLRENLKDARDFGPGFLLRHSLRLTGAKVSAVNVPGVGKVFVRPGQSDVAALRQVFVDRDYDLGESSTVTARVRDRYETILASGRTSVVVDAGANIGSASLWFHARYPRAAVVAVEPEAGNSSILDRNAAARSQITVLNAAIDSKSGFVAVENEGMG